MRIDRHDAGNAQSGQRAETITEEVKMSHPQQLGLRENSQMSEVKLRLMGFPEDVEAIATLLHNSLEVVEESTDYQNRDSQYIRRYLTVRRQTTTNRQLIPIH